MRPVRFTMTEAGTSDPVVLDLYIAPFQVAVHVDMSVGATVDYTLQYTYSDPFAAGVIWIDDTTIDNEVASSTVNITNPIMAVRIVAATLTGGTLDVHVLQAGNGL